jgi:hypothetical protein
MWGIFCREELLCKHRPLILLYRWFHTSFLPQAHIWAYRVFFLDPRQTKFFCPLFLNLNRLHVSRVPVRC